MNTSLRALCFAVITGTIAGPATAFALPAIARDVDELIVNVLCEIVNYLFIIALVVGILMALFAAYKYLTSSGDPNKVSEAHKTLTYAAVGLAVAILAGSFPVMVWSLMGTPEAFPTC